jgi:hypothetical protein
MLTCELRDKWAEALKSGKFKQTKGALQRDDGYCCLGVLCVIAGIPSRKKTKHLTAFAVEDVYGNKEATITLPKNIAGLDDNNEISRLAKMNDTGTCFSEIAKKVRKLPCADD